jgi:hypothetical protein
MLKVELFLRKNHFQELFTMIIKIVNFDLLDFPELLGEGEYEFS